MSKESGREEKLFKQFPPISKTEWKDQVVKDLKGREFDKIIWKTYENIDVDPFYTKDDLDSIEYPQDSIPGDTPFVRGTSPKNNDWKINQEIVATNVHDANKLALKCISGGVDSITFNCDKDTGLELKNDNDITALLAGIDIEKVQTHFLRHDSPIELLSLFINEAKKRGFNLAELQGSIDCDPIRDFTLTGEFSNGEQYSFNELRETISYLADHLPKFKALKIHSSQFHESGASITQELAGTLASGVEYMDRLTEMDLTVDQICDSISFSFSTGSNYFMEIAKLRAARLLWARIIEQYPIKNDSSKLMNIEVTNSSWNKTLYDPYVNLLRGTVEAMAGAIGGAGTITVRPFNSEVTDMDEFSMRLARNTQLILKNESYLERIADVSGGSYYIENLTNSIAKESWKQFQDIEKTGGFLKSFNSEHIQNSIEETRKSRDMNIALRKDTFLGVNQYPNSEEILSGKIQIQQANNNVNTKVKTLVPYRGAQQFEELRLNTEKYFEKTGKKPVVFLLTIGNPSMRTARASFSANLFGCAGFEIINNIGFDITEQGVDAAIEKNSDIVVICSSDNEYPDFAPEICRLLAESNPQIKVIIAGNPKEHKKVLEDCGVNDFIHVRSNALELLKKYQNSLGIEEE